MLPMVEQWYMTVSNVLPESYTKLMATSNVEMGGVQ